MAGTLQAYLKLEGGVACTKKDVDPTKVEALSNADEKKTAEQARQAALSILRDALKKKDRVLMEDGPHDPMPSATAASLGKAQGAMMRYAIITLSDVDSLVKKMERIQFKKNEKDPKLKKVYAYVYPKDETLTVYLCPQFWRASPHLSKDSQPGTLIHEVSHFLGSEDITYAKRDVKVAMGGNFYQVGKGERAALANPEADCEHYGLLRNNANSIEYEFEILLNHRKPWNGSCFPCCEEKLRNSVCEKAVTDEFAFFLGD